jgi:hypothetical protein
MVSRAMARDRFLEIKKYFHLADNNNIDHDKMFKLRPLTNILNKNFRQRCIFHKDLSIDEAMVKYFGHHCAKFVGSEYASVSKTGCCVAPQDIVTLLKPTVERITRERMNRLVLAGML